METIWADWKVVRMIGEGSFGKVYEVVRDRFGIEERSAVKVITIPSSPSEAHSLRSEGMTDNDVTLYYKGIVQDFVQEIALMSKLRGHANIVDYEDYEVVERSDEFGWKIYIRMELLTPLTSLMLNNQTHTIALSEQEIVKMAIDLCSALEACFERRIVHRDIKPDNIFVSQNGTYKLGDFGVAKTVEKTVSGLSKKGTYTFMAPEIYKGEPGGMNSDLYSLGVVMYRLLNDGREPFAPPAPQPINYEMKQEALARRMRGEPLPLPAHASAAVFAIIQKACAFDPSARYQTPLQMKADLLALSAAPAPVSKPMPQPAYAAMDKTVAATPPVNIPSVAPTPPAATVTPPASDTVAKPKKKRGLKLLIILLIAAAVIGVGVWFLFYIGFGQFTGPLGGLKRGIYNMAKEDSVSFSASVEEEDYTNNQSNVSTFSGRATYDVENQNLTAVITANNTYSDGDGSTVTIAMKNGDVYQVIDDARGYKDSNDAENDAALETFDLAQKALSGEEVNWDDALEDEDSPLYEMELGEYVNSDNINDIIAISLERLDDEAWLENQLGFSTENTSDGTEYRFECTAYDLWEASTDVLDGNVDNEEQYKFYKQALKDNKDETQTIDVTIVFTVKGNTLVGFSFDAHDGEHRVAMSMFLSDLGSTEVTEEEINEVIDKYKSIDCLNCDEHDETYGGYCWRCAEEKFGYCHNCYATMSEETDTCPECGSPLTCQHCGTREYVSYDGYCYDCANELFGYCPHCYTTLRSYSDTCHSCGKSVVCPGCGTREGLYYDGYCYDCAY